MTTRLEPDRRRRHRPRRRRRRGRRAARGRGLERRRSRGRHAALGARLRARRAAQQLPRLAARGAEVQSRDPGASAERRGARQSARGDPSDDERRRRHDAALLGAELALESVGLQGRQRDDAPLRRRRGSRAARRSRIGRSASRSSSRTTTRSSTRSACRARPATSKARSIARGNIFEGARARAVPDAAAARHGVHGAHGGAGAAAGLASVSGAGGRSTRRCIEVAARASITASATAAVATSSAKNSTAVSTIPRAERTGNLSIVTEAHVTRIDVDAEGRAAGVQYLKGGETYIQPALGRAARGLHVRERAPVVAVDVAPRIRAASRTIAAKSAGTISRTTKAAACSRCSRTS